MKNYDENYLDEVKRNGGNRNRTICKTNEICNNISVVLYGYHRRDVNVIYCLLC